MISSLIGRMVQFITLVLVLLTASAVNAATSRISLASTVIFDVMRYGAKGNGKTDDSQAFMKAWTAACQSKPNAKSIVNIPGGRTYLLKPVAFTGPCKPSKMFVQVLGSIQNTKYCKIKHTKQNGTFIFLMVKNLEIKENCITMFSPSSLEVKKQ
ncbi:putative endo-polygalacturonase [Helianthus annuus]|nr:putative endo-polygalacturonase [Helianthus annuus]KAJ0697392.1 putative endo-polygalacturonase [Helianthus annuus]